MVRWCYALLMPILPTGLGTPMRKVLFDYYYPNTAKHAAKQISWGKSAIDDVRDYDKFNDVPYGC